MRVIKKYGNRRLYDTSSSSYINQADLAGLVRAGEELQIVDAESGADLTRSVLLAILIEGEGLLELFPTGLLHRVIRYGSSHPLHRVLLPQVRVGLELLDHQLRALEQQFGGMGTPQPGPAPRTATTPPPPTGDERSTAAPPPATPESPSPAASRSATPSSATSNPVEPELDELRSRLAALEARLKRD
jgi:polyhydroxyalkanoate synthesis repressor PhaR